MEQHDNWPSGWLKSSLRICVLRLIEMHDGTYGHEVISLLAAHGLGNVGGGTLYPLLRRLVDDGLVQTTWVEGDHGPSRKTYTITATGSRELQEQADLWFQFTQVTNQLLNGRGTENA